MILSKITKMLKMLAEVWWWCGEKDDVMEELSPRPP